MDPKHWFLVYYIGFNGEILVSRQDWANIYIYYTIVPVQHVTYMLSVAPSSLATQFRVDPARFCNKCSQARSQWYIYISTIGFRAFVWLFVNWRESSWPIGSKSLGPNRHSTRKDNQQSNKWKLKTFSKFKLLLFIVID